MILWQRRWRTSQHSQGKSTKIQNDDPWPHFSIVSKRVLTICSNELQKLANIGHQFKKCPHLPNTESVHYLKKKKKKLLAADPFFKIYYVYMYILIASRWLSYQLRTASFPLLYRTGKNSSSPLAPSLAYEAKCSHYHFS